MNIDQKPGTSGMYYAIDTLPFGRFCTEPPFANTDCIIVTCKLSGYADKDAIIAFAKTHDCEVLQRGSRGTVCFYMDESNPMCTELFTPSGIFKKDVANQIFSFMDGLEHINFISVECGRRFEDRADSDWTYYGH